MRIVGAFLAAFLLTAGNAGAGANYEAPKGCEALATLRLPNCLVRQVSRCAGGNIEDSFHEGVFAGRAYFTHPALFVRFEGADGSVTGHKYGAGVPANDAVLTPGSRYSYTREAYRNRGGAEPGDDAQETMIAGERTVIELDNRSYDVLDIRFEVEDPGTGYRYRERALLLVSPALTIGIIGSTTQADGTRHSVSTIPESISLPGDRGFLSNDPAPSCLPGT